LNFRHDKFYQIFADVRKLKGRILSWIGKVITQSTDEDNIMLVLASHGSESGSILIGGDSETGSVAYLTHTELVKRRSRKRTGKVNWSWQFGKESIRITSRTDLLR
jgi:hypothetical protein